MEYGLSCSWLCLPCSVFIYVRKSSNILVMKRDESAERCEVSVRERWVFCLAELRTLDIRNLSYNKILVP
jgi:hypothetical protein